MWLEGKKEEEGVIPCTWVVEDKKIVYWPSKINAQNALNKREDPDPNSWRKFPLLKVKIVSNSFEECDQYELTSTVESERSSSDLEGEDGLGLKARRKRIKKILPEDFINSQDLDCSAVVPSVQQRVDSNSNQASAPTPPQKVVPSSHLKQKLSFNKAMCNKN